MAPAIPGVLHPAAGAALGAGGGQGARAERRQRSGGVGRRREASGGVGRRRRLGVGGWGSVSWGWRAFLSVVLDGFRSWSAFFRGAFRPFASVPRALLLQPSEMELLPGLEINRFHVEEVGFPVPDLGSLLRVFALLCRSVSS